MSETPSEKQGGDSTRRGFMKILLGFSTLATLGGVLTPVIGYLWPQTRQASGEQGRQKVASLAAIQAAGGLVVAAGSQPIVLTYSDQAGVRAFSAICTHLGCVVKWESNGGFIQCPCHDGRFNAQTGSVISGPPPSPLPSRQVVVDGDDIYIVT